VRLCLSLESQTLANGSVQEEQVFLGEVSYLYLEKVTVSNGNLPPLGLVERFRINFCRANILLRCYTSIKERTLKVLADPF
jgi:hypothetical protein